MVLESLSTPQSAEKRPWNMLVLGGMYAALAVFLALWVFREESSMIMVLLTVIACTPLMCNTMNYEEQKDVTFMKKRFLFKEHTRALAFFIFLFIGFVLAYSLAYILLPSTTVDVLFQAQEQTIQDINGGYLGKSIQDVSNNSVNTQHFIKIFSNNLKVLLFAIFFSFFYGAGAIFILTWNATVISAAIGNFFRVNLSTYATSAGLSQVGNYLSIFSISFLRYFIHGIPEILGYFIGGLAGGIISVAVIRHDIGSPEFKKTLMDSVDLIILAIFVLLVAGFLEVYITPLFF